MKSCVFAGPTLYQRETYGLSVFPPARLGSAFWAWRNGYHRIAIVDGYFGSIPSIWHKELLYVISQGVQVWGAGSIGALRAAELWKYGMGGVGKIWRLYKKGVITDDDEVCVTHAPQYMDYQPLTEALVNVRLSVRALRRYGMITVQQESILIETFKNLHFSERSNRNLRLCFSRVLGSNTHLKVWKVYSRISRDQKGMDADSLVRGLANESLPSMPKQDWVFPETLHWRRQFVERLGDLPDGDKDPFF